MIGFTTAANGVFAALVACTFIFTRNSVTDSGIEIENAYFTYDEKKANAIDGITLSIKPGEHVAFVDPSELKVKGGIYNHMISVQMQSENWKMA